MAKYTGKYPRRIAQTFSIAGSRGSVIRLKANDGTTVDVTGTITGGKMPQLNESIDKYIELAESKRATNPIKRTGVSAKKYVARPSQITQSAPTKRLKARRKENLNAGETGFFPNPASSSRAAFLNERVKLLAKLCKLPTQDQYPKIGALLLNKVHGARYQITQVTSAGGAESDLSGTLTISEMEEWLSGAITIADARFKSV